MLSIEAARFDNDARCTSCMRMPRLVFRLDEVVVAVVVFPFLGDVDAASTVALLVAIYTREMCREIGVAFGHLIMALAVEKLVNKALVTACSGDGCGMPMRQRRFRCDERALATIRIRGIESNLATSVELAISEMAASILAH